MKVEPNDDRNIRKRHAGEWLAWVTALLLAAVVCASLVWSERDYTMKVERRRMEAQALIIGQNLGRQLAAVRSVLDNVRSTIVERNAGCAAACRAATIHALRSAMPGVRALMLVDRGGRVLYADGEAGTQRLDDRRFVASLATMRSARTLYLSASTERGSGIADVKAAMPVDAGQPAAAMVLVAILDPAYFDVVMRSALYASDMTSAVTDESGARLLFVPYGDRVRLRDAPGYTPFYLRHLRSGQAGTVMEGTPDPARGPRIVAQRSVAARPLGLDRMLVVGVSRSLDAVRRPWLRLMWEYGTAWTAVALIGSAALLLRQRRRRWARELAATREAERAAAAERIELALGGADLGLWDWHLDTGKFCIDARGLAILGYAATEVERTCSAWTHQIHPEDRRAVEQALLASDHVGGAFDVEYRMRHRCGEWVWILSRGRVIERDAAGRPLRLAGTRMDIGARKRAEAEIVQIAFHDGLTGLPNRRLLRDRLTQALAKSARNRGFGALLFLDLDNFKRLNDTLGHHMGDLLLERVAMRLREATRDTDTVARLGGDEFVVLLEGLGVSAPEAQANAELVAAKIVAVLDLRHTIEGHEIHCTPSVGIAMFDAHTRSVDDLLRQGDMAMYEAKAGGRNGYRFFDPALQANAEKDSTLDAELRHALAAREFVLFFQPILDEHGRTVGAEALVRWQHPQRGLVGPAHFIDQAEKSGLIVDIGNWVLEAACRQLVQWSGATHTAGLTLAVNISARHARQPDFVQQVGAILARSGADPALLKLELTESLLVDNVDEMIGKMRALKEAGVGFALDDFGTGYSSLSYLERLPIAQLKIDRSFIADMLVTRNAATIVRAIVTLAANLGLEVVAEGVEQEAQRRALLEFGCRRFQGFLFTPPLPIASLAPWLAPTTPCRALVLT